MNDPIMREGKIYFTAETTAGMLKPNDHFVKPYEPSQVYIVSKVNRSSIAAFPEISPEHKQHFHVGHPLLVLRPGADQL